MVIIKCNEIISFCCALTGVFLNDNKRCYSILFCSVIVVYTVTVVLPAPGQPIHDRSQQGVLQCLQALLLLSILMTDFFCFAPEESLNNTTALRHICVAKSMWKTASPTSHSKTKGTTMKLVTLCSCNTDVGTLLMGFAAIEVGC